MLRDKIEMMLSAWDSSTPSLNYKAELFCINEGDLLKFIVDALAATLGKDSKSFQFAIQRIPPINVLRKIVDKQSKIYNEPPSRMIVNGSSGDTELMEYYIKALKMNSQLDVANEFYNLTKIAFAMPQFDPIKSKHSLKILLPHQFLPFGSDPQDRMRLTELMTYQGTIENKKHFYAYSEEEFIHFDDTGRQYPTLTGGENIYGAIPGAYVRKSRNLLYPKDDTDMKAMTVLIPTMLADLNLASMFSCFSIMYGIDVADEDRKYAPNAFWHLNSRDDTDAKPQIGTIKPEADIEQTLRLITSEFAMWLDSKGIKPGTIGDMNTENIASGISKMVDEMDTFEDRQKQATVFSEWESQDLWPLIMHKMHPVWVAQGMNTNQMFTPTAEVVVEFPEQKPLKSRSDRVAELSTEVQSGFMSRREAVRRLNPKMDDDQLDEMMEEIDEPAEVTE